jgi:hypothetical protein
MRRAYWISKTEAERKIRRALPRAQESQATVPAPTKISCATAGVTKEATNEIRARGISRKAYQEQGRSTTVTGAFPKPCKGSREHTSANTYPVFPEAPSFLTETSESNYGPEYGWTNCCGSRFNVV